MTRSPEQAQVLAGFDRNRAIWDRAIAEIGLDRMETPRMMGDWTPKDLIAHVMGWRRKTINSLAATIAGEGKIPTPWPESLNDPNDAEEDGDVQTINNWIYVQNRNRPAADLVAEANASWDEFRSLIANLPTSALTSKTYWPRAEGESIAEIADSGKLYGHFNEHLEEDIEPWLNANGRRS